MRKNNSTGARIVEYWGKNIILTFNSAYLEIEYFAWWVDTLSSVIIHSEICLIFVFSIAKTKMPKKSQMFRAFPVFSVIKQRNSPFDNIAEIIDHLPVATVQIIELVTPLGSQLYCLFKSLLKYSLVNVYDQLVVHNFTKDFDENMDWK